MTGLSGDTVRAWERRYGAVVPQRSKTGRRVYSDPEINRLKLLAELVRNGFSIGTIARKSDQELVAALAQAKEGSVRPTNESMSGEVEALLCAVQSFDLVRIREGIARLRFLSSPRDFAFYIVPQLMIQVGVQIDQKKMDISQEHALSDLVRYHLRQIFEDLQPAENPARVNMKMIFSAPEGQYHDLGLLLAAAACRFRGINCHFLGANLPVASLLQAAKDLKANAVVASLVVLPPEDTKITPQDFVNQLDLSLPSGVSLWIGGSAAGHIRRPKSKREIWIFETMDGLESKLDSVSSAKGAVSR